MIPIDCKIIKFSLYLFFNAVVVTFVLSSIQVCFWLLDNGYRVLIAACDTFRSGAVEQLRTHTAHLSALHPPQHSGPPNVQLFERGYNKDAAGIAMEAILYGEVLFSWRWCNDHVIYSQSTRV